MNIRKILIDLNYEGLISKIEIWKSNPKNEKTKTIFSTFLCWIKCKEEQ
jgi:uncharacterized protein YuzE